MDPSFQLRPLSDLWSSLEPKAKVLPTEEKGDFIVGGKLDAAVMFVDLCGFSKLGWEYRDRPQAAAIVAHKGLLKIERGCEKMPSLGRAYVDKVIGDAVMLVIPGPREQAMSDVLWIAHGTFFDSAFPCKIGAHWGSVFLGEIGLRESPAVPARIGALTVMGPVVNVAARLCALAREKRNLVLLSDRIDRAPRPLKDVTTHLKELRHFKRRYEWGDLKGCGDRPLRVVRFVCWGWESEFDDTKDELAMAVCHAPTAPALDAPDPAPPPRGCLGFIK